MVKQSGLSITMTLAKKAEACVSSYKKMAHAIGGMRFYGKDTPLPLWRVLDVCGLDDALWALRCTLPEQDDLKRRVVSLWLADVLERIEHLMTDERSKAIIPMLRRHAEIPIPPRKWFAARADVWPAAHAAAWGTAWFDARATAGNAAHVAAHSAARFAAWDAASGDDWDAVRAAERQWQSDRLRQYLMGER